MVIGQYVGLRTLETSQYATAWPSENCKSNNEKNELGFLISQKMFAVFRQNPLVKLVPTVFAGVKGNQ